MPQGYPLGLLGTLQNDWGLLGPMGTTMPTPQAPKGLGDPRTMGLLSAAAGMLQAAGPSPRPISVGQGIGMGAMQGIGSYQDALKSQREQEYYKSLIAAQQAKIEKAKNEAEAEKKARDARGGLGGLLGGVPPDIAGNLDAETWRSLLNQTGQDRRHATVPAGTAYSVDAANQRHATVPASTIYAQGAADQRVRPIVTSDDLGRPVSRTDFIPGQGYGPTQTMPTGAPMLPPAPPIPEASIANMAEHLGPYSRLAEIGSKAGAFVGAGSNETRDRARSSYASLRPDFFDLRALPGARSNKAIDLALASLPDLGVFENPERAKTALTVTFEHLKAAREQAVHKYENALDKTTRREAYELVQALDSLFQRTALTVDLSGPGPIPRADPKDEALMIELLGQ